MNTGSIGSQGSVADGDGWRSPGSCLCLGCCRRRRSRHTHEENESAPIGPPWETSSSIDFLAGGDRPRRGRLHPHRCFRPRGSGCAMIDDERIGAAHHRHDRDDGRDVRRRDRWHLGVRSTWAHACRTAVAGADPRALTTSADTATHGLFRSRWTDTVDAMSGRDEMPGARPAGFARGPCGGQDGANAP